MAGFFNPRTLPVRTARVNPKHVRQNTAQLDSVSGFHNPASVSPLYRSCQVAGLAELRKP